MTEQSHEPEGTTPEEQAGDQDAGPASTPDQVPGEDVTEGGDEPAG